MSRIAPTVSLLGVLLLAAIAAPALAENEGQEDLDKATQLKVAAESLDDLNEVVDQAESALEKGLDADNKKFAQQLLISSLLQRGQLFCSGGVQCAGGGSAARVAVDAIPPIRPDRFAAGRQPGRQARRSATAHRETAIVAAWR